MSTRTPNVAKVTSYHFTFSLSLVFVLASQRRRFIQEEEAHLRSWCQMPVTVVVGDLYVMFTNCSSWLDPIFLLGCHLF